MRLLLFILFGFVIQFSVCAQERYYFEKTPEIFPDISECPENEYLSKEVSIKLEQFNQLYTNQVERKGAHYIASTEIIKPDLYYSIQRLSKYFCKCMKKGMIKKDEAERELLVILEKCLQIASQDTRPVEAELRAANDPNAIVEIFDKIVIQQN